MPHGFGLKEARKPSRSFPALQPHGSEGLGPSAAGPTPTPVACVLPLDRKRDIRRVSFCQSRFIEKETYKTLLFLLPPPLPKVQTTNPVKYVQAAPSCPMYKHRDPFPFPQYIQMAAPSPLYKVQAKSSIYRGCYGLVYPKGGVSLPPPLPPAQ